MSSPFKALDLRSKLFLWSLAILLAGTLLFTNADRLTREVDNLVQDATEQVDFSVFQNPFETFLSEDPDEDGLTNALEILLGGNIENPDTDGDSFSDYKEFLGGYDLTSDREAAYSTDELEAFFAVFHEEFGQFFDIRTFYYTSRAEALIADGQEDAAQIFLDLVQTQEGLTE